MPTKFFIIILIFPIMLIAKPNKGFEAEFKYTKFSIIHKKNKIILKCKPLAINSAYSTNWIDECNNLAFNLLSKGYYQEILVDKEVADIPFGSLSYQTAKESGSFMQRKSLRKAFKIIQQK